MTEWFASFNSVEQMFLLAGIVGGIILVLRLILTDRRPRSPRWNGRGSRDSDGASRPSRSRASRRSSRCSAWSASRCIATPPLGIALALVGALAAGIVVRVDHPQDVQGDAAPAVERHRQPVRRGRQRRLGLSHGRQGRRPRADQLRQSPARVRGGVGRWHRRLPTGTAIRVQSVEANTLVVAPVER